MAWRCRAWDGFHGNTTYYHVNVIPPDHVDEVHVVEPNQHDDVHEDKNEPELTYPYEEVDPLNPSPPASMSEADDEIEVENPIEHDNKTVPASVHETTHALVEKKGKAKDKFYGKLILKLGNEVSSSVEQGTDAMEKLVKKLGNTEDKVEFKKLKKELEEASVDAAIVVERVRQENVRNDASGSGPARGQDATLDVRKCTFDGFMKCNPAVFCGVEGAVELQRWFEKTESVFEISECAEGKKTVNQMPWTEVKQLMTREFCPIEEVQRMEHELWNLKVKEYDNSQKQRNVRAMVTAPTDGKLPLCERCFTRHVGQCTIKCHKCERLGIRQGITRRSVLPRGLTLSLFRLVMIVVSKVILGTDVQRRLNTRFSAMLDIDPIKIKASYEVELADERVASTNTILRGCTLNLVNHIFEIDLMPIELGTFDVIIVYSKDVEEHENHLKIILELLKRERLYAKFLKCDFWLDSVQFLGYVIDHSGVHVDPAKIETIKSWAAPTTLTDSSKYTH
nr:putative reverse transcriptase domain-containing protein [Tanacetum cinerariifolium]